MKKILFIDRDGTIISETKDEQIDCFEKLEFLDGVFRYLSAIASETDYEFVMVTNQDGLGTGSFPEDTFWPVQNFIINTLKKEGVNFSDVYIDRSFPHENAPTRKPRTAMLTKYMTDEYNLTESYVIGDRYTDIELAKNLGCKAVWLNHNTNLGNKEVSVEFKELLSYIALETDNWKEIYNFLKAQNRKAEIKRKTNETDIHARISLDGTGACDIKTGLGFFDHMLEQLSKHSGINMFIRAEGDLHIDEHHLVEDTAIVLGEAFLKALGSKAGIERYGFFLPMDDCSAQVGIDFGGRPWLVWDVEFKREKIGDFPTELFFHFFKTFSDSAKCNLHIIAKGENEHHKAEAIFKAMARSVKQAVSRSIGNNSIPSTKGLL